MALSRYTTLLLGLLLACVSARAAIVVGDDAGRSVTLERPAQRIVSLSPHATELLFAAGAGARVVGVAAYSDYPPAATPLPQVGDAHALDLERILALRPDLVVAWLSGNSRQQVERLEASGIAVYFSEPRTAPDVATNLERLGQVAGTADAGRAAAQRYRAELAKLEQDYRGARPVKLFYEIWHAPVMTLSGRHFVSDILARCGAHQRVRRPAGAGAHRVAGSGDRRRAGSHRQRRRRRSDRLLGGAARAAGGAQRHPVRSRRHAHAPRRAAPGGGGAGAVRLHREGAPLRSSGGPRPPSVVRRPRDALRSAAGHPLWRAGPARRSSALQRGPGLLPSVGSAAVEPTCKPAGGRGGVYPGRKQRPATLSMPCMGWR